MDATQISILSTSISTAIDMARALVGVRDATAIAQQTTALNDVLLNTQQALLRHNAEMFELQQKYFEAREELRKLKEAINESSRYPLVNLGCSVFAYRVDVVPEQSGTSQPTATQTPHYLCQPCLDVRGHKSVLQVGEYAAICSVCKRNSVIKQRPPAMAIGTGPRFNAREW